MIEEKLNQELMELKTKMRKKKKWQLQIVDYENELTAIEENISFLSNQLKEEEKDVEKLEGLSFSNLVQTLLGNKVEKLEKEKQEVPTVQIQLNEAKKHKKDVELEISNLQYRIEKMGDVEYRYNEIFTKKEGIIKQSASSTTLFEFSEQEEDLRAYIEELDEALIAGNKTKADLDIAGDSIDNAATWGVFDMFGGGAISGLLKHSNMDEAMEAINRAQKSLRKFQKELLDVEADLNISIDISSMLKFADFFLDNFFTDYLVQERINESQDQISQKQLEVGRIVENIKEQIHLKENELEQVVLDRRRFVEDF
ncbi:hypothetical protein NSA56_03425 [Oceanobacillus caeni]|uniref:hypothetical protein n=1 Tax=Oceanobacillus caeni TaxID=405946 RepID=UPI00214A5CBA|nr:hypothetical protein [Oceanobacillus caeni]MCR1833445.1 hypothetical protein [Oceanobacillus caeni]